jgi:hypothetical protein
MPKNITRITLNRAEEDIEKIKTKYPFIFIGKDE